MAPAPSASTWTGDCVVHAHDPPTARVHRPLALPPTDDRLSFSGGAEGKRGTGTGNPFRGRDRTWLRRAPTPAARGRACVGFRETPRAAVNDLVIVRGCRFRRRPVVERVSQEVKEDEMDIPRVVSPGQWLAARKDLLAREKEATHAKDAVDAARRALPVTEVTKDYTLTGPGGQVSLADLFDGRRQ